MSGVHTPLAIGIPLAQPYRPAIPEWTFSLLTQNWPLGLNITWIGQPDDPRLPPPQRITQVRNEIVAKARRYTPKYLWMIDDDTEPPVHAARYLIRELERDPSIGICAGIYGTKETEPQPMVWRKKGDFPATWRPGEIFPVDLIATGCMMIRMEVFDKMPPPYFLMSDRDCVYSTREREVIFSDSQGEDMFFCEQVARQGYKVIAHGGVLCTHWDPYTHTPHYLPEIIKVDLPENLSWAVGKAAAR